VIRPHLCRLSAGTKVHGSALEVQDPIGYLCNLRAESEAFGQVKDVGWNAQPGASGTAPGVDGLMLVADQDNASAVRVPQDGFDLDVTQILGARMRTEPDSKGRS
jgi:hypothetical protein